METHTHTQAQLFFSDYSEPETAELQHEAKSGNHVLMIQHLFQNL